MKKYCEPPFQQSPSPNKGRHKKLKIIFYTYKVKIYKLGVDRSKSKSRVTQLNISPYRELS
jgi:hypothetical protein